MKTNKLFLLITFLLITLSPTFSQVLKQLTPNDSIKYELDFLRNELKKSAYQTNVGKSLMLGGIILNTSAYFCILNEYNSEFFGPMIYIGTGCIFLGWMTEWYANSYIKRASIRPTNYGASITFILD